jgi:homoserine dehydrogenase
VEGHDVPYKLAILAKLASGKTVAAPAKDIPCTGISNIQAADLEFAKHHLSNSTIKLVGVASRDATRLSIYVTPALVPGQQLLAAISGSGNCVAVTSENMGQCLYSGPGAGRYPTANSIVSDIVRVAKGTAEVDAFPTPAAAPVRRLRLDPDYTASFYIRVLTGSDPTEAAKFIEGYAEQEGVPIDQTYTSTINSAVCVTTKQVNVSKVQELTKQLLIVANHQHVVARNHPSTILFMPILTVD